MYLKLKKCIVCGDKLTGDEERRLAPEFKPYPVHGECFDTFENADDFIEYAKEKTKTKIKKRKKKIDPDKIVAFCIWQDYEEEKKSFCGPIKYSLAIKEIKRYGHGRGALYKIFDIKSNKTLEEGRAFDLIWDRG